MVLVFILSNVGYGEMLERADRGSTGCCSFLHAWPVDLANFTIFSDADMRSVHGHDVSLFRNMVGEGAPTRLTGERNASETTERERFAPSLGHDLGHIFFVAVVVEFIGATRVSEDSVSFGVTVLSQSGMDHLFDVSAG